jgi:dTDP-4-dehydrorhamnose 3,5-epimerase-like enzyme
MHQYYAYKFKLRMINIMYPDKIGSDDRGYTYEYFHERYGLHLICFRKKGSISGRHYHKGISLTKNPEILILCSGSIELRWRETTAADLQIQIIEGPAKIEIPAYIWHEIIAITDCTFIELNALSEHKADTFYDSLATQ